MNVSRLFWIGFVFILSMVIFIFGLLYIQDISIRKSNYTFTVLFDNVQGLNVGDQVDMLGKKIGKVTQTHFRSQKVAVEVTIDNRFSFSIPVDSEIEVKSEGLIGSKYIAITPGHNRKDYILPGATVEGRREFDFTEITPGIVPMTQDLSAFARQLKATLGEEEKNKIRSTIENIESFTSGLDTFVQNYQDIISVDDKKNISTTLENLKDITSDLNNGINTEIIKLGNILNNIKKFTDETDEFIATIKEFKNTSQSFKNATDKLDNILYKIEIGDGTVGKLLNDDVLHNNINNLVDDLRLLVQDVKDNPIRYMKAYWRGKK